MLELIDKQKAQTEIALIAKHLARSDAQQAIIGRILFMIDNLPIIEAAPVRNGRWIRLCDGEYYCSECQAHLVNYRAYCGKCGARMDGGADDEEA